ATTLQGKLNTGALRNAKIGTLADDLCANVDSIDADGIVGSVPNVLIGFARRFEIRADAAKPKQIYRSCENGAHDLHGRSNSLADTNCRRSLSTQRYRLLRTR